MPRQTEKWAHIQLKDNIPDEVRTEGKDDAADKIQTLIERGEWPVSLSRLDDETEWSRSHYRNVLTDYFERVDDTETVKREGREIVIPDGVDTMSYLEGYTDGLQNGT